MLNQIYAPLINKLEKYSQKNPKAYKSRVKFLAILGYLYIIGIILVTIATLIFLFHRLSLPEAWVMRKIISYLIVFCLFILVVIIKAIFAMIFVKFEHPQGVIATQKQLPNLLRLINDLNSQLNCLPIHRVLITSDYNAFVTQIPTLGILGNYKNYLVIGLPLMYALSPLQFKAILAHELGHISANHSAFNGWIYRSRLTWEIVLKQVEKLNSWRALLVWLIFLFFYWYIPYFEAYTFVLARQDEYQADAIAKDLVGKETIASALVTMEIKGYYLDIVLKKISQKLNRGYSIPSGVLDEIVNTLTQEFKQEDNQELLAQALTKETDLIDTHPCLKERVLALGIDLNNFNPFVSYPENAAQKYIGNLLPDLTAKINEEWYKANL